MATMDTPPTKAETNGHPPPPLRILVVDDSHDAADSLALLLTVLGYRVRTAYDGPAALDVAGTFLPQIAFLDLGLPGMDGFEVARRLRERPASRGAVLIACTGFGQEADRRRCQEAGFDHFLLKPFDLHELKQALARQAGDS
jgi:CheY-like chemotaxis protein